MSGRRITSINASVAAFVALALLAVIVLAIRGLDDSASGSSAGADSPAVTQW
jgi:hypothetical protein